MKNILITGAAGFLGSHLCDFFLSKGFYVIGIDNFFTGSKKNLEHLKSNKFFDFIDHDVCDKLTINKKIDYILHFASPASPIDYLKYPIETLKIGSTGTENILNFALNKKSRIVVASTSEIYGDPLEHPQKENYFGNVNPVGPRGVYDEAKRFLEAITTAYHTKLGLNSGIVRVFNTYGPRMRVNDGRAIPNFINQSLKHSNITIYGNGKQTRSFCYVSDTVLGVYKLLLSDYSFPVNIGNPTEFSINKLVSLIQNLIPSNSKITFHDLPENDPKIRKPDITRAKDLLNWEPKVELKDGLQLTLNYFLKNYK